MTRFLAYMGNDPKHVHRALEVIKGAIEPVEACGGWGVGFEQESRMLLRAHPQKTDRAVDLLAVASDLQTRAFVGHLGWRDDLPRAPENAQPHRWRHILFALAGTVAPLTDRRAALLEAVPDFLRRNIRGHSDTELIFHRFLIHLKEAAGTLQTPIIPLDAATAALQKTLLELEGWAREEEAPAPELAVVVTSGRAMLAASFGKSVSMKRIDGLTGRDPVTGREAPNPDFKAVVASAGFDHPEGWSTVEPGHIATVGVPNWESRTISIR